MLSQFLRNTLIAATFTLPFFPFPNQTALAGDRRDFIVYNNNELEITRLYVSSQLSEYWGRNILDSDIVSGTYESVTFNNNSNQCVYDIKAIYSDGSYDVGRTNLCDTYTVTFYGHGGDHK
ncbi:MULTISPECIES: hypothetical protein [Calothrix]|uniref:Uncharacterized protein n=2 Tax=Calothrix TaxID=1186 RepID=A0ABR8AK81_9CYAN|nr:MULTISPECIES: hypothetical protein [Calothrix]MBD2199645.1 hypothetical protein [Calothrix parietina FACHB-288]MBD2228448.1 hypothetical protein [Calothrix anomala FACHB-343]